MRKFEAEDEVIITKTCISAFEVFEKGEIGVIKEFFTSGKQTEYAVQFDGKRGWFSKNNFKLNKSNANTL
jgi:hypothetical protein